MVSLEEIRTNNNSSRDYYKKTRIQFEGYRGLLKNKTNKGKGRGIAIAVKEELKNIAVIGIEEEPGEQIRIDMEG